MPQLERDFLIAVQHGAGGEVPTTKKRPHRSPEQKAAILKRHPIDEAPVSKICEEFGVQPSLFDHWQRELFARAPHMLGNGAGIGSASSREAELERKVAALEAKLAKKDAVIDEIGQEYVERNEEVGEA